MEYSKTKLVAQGEIVVCSRYIKIFLYVGKRFTLCRNHHVINICKACLSQGYSTATDVCDR